VQIDVPRDRTSEFEPQLVRKGQARFDSLDENIISLYARGMTQRGIQGHLEDLSTLLCSVSSCEVRSGLAWRRT
jgi:putative transposase